MGIEIPKIAAFDFDGTLTTRDSMFAFIESVGGKSLLIMGLIRLSPMLILFKLGLIDRQKAKERLLYYFFKGTDEIVLKTWAKDFCEKELPAMLNPEMMERLAWHQQQGHRCFLVSASLDLWLQPFAEQHQLELLSTQAQFSKGKYHRNFLCPNCYGPEKVKRLQAALEGQPAYFSYAYGDSNGDREMLEWADEDVLIGR